MTNIDTSHIPSDWAVTLAAGLSPDLQQSRYVSSVSLPPADSHPAPIDVEALDTALKACDAAYEAWQTAVQVEARYAACADTWISHLTKRAERAMLTDTPVSAAICAQADAACDRIQEKLRLKKYITANKRSDYYMTVFAYMALGGTVSHG